MSETAAEPTADKTPAKIYVCPACGAKYDEPTTCSNGHDPTECVEYDRATFEAAQAGDAEAAAAIAEAASSVGGTAGIPAAAPESTPAPIDGSGVSVPAPVPAEVVPGTAEPVAAEPAAEAPAAVEVIGDAVSSTGGTPAGPATDTPASGATDAAATEPTPPASSISDVLHAAATAVEDAAAAIRAAITAASGQ